MYLSSFRMGEHPERLVGLLGGRAGRAAVIANAMDAQPEVERAEGVQRELDALADLGLEAEELDLRDYFGVRGLAGAKLARYALVWLRGGNVFVLRHALAASGADAALVELVSRDALVYAGYSAGPCCAGPTLRGLELVDDPNAVRAAHGGEPVWDGLRLLDYVVVPHYRSPGHPETERVSQVADNYRATGVPHRTLSDGQAVVIDGAMTEIV